MCPVAHRVGPSLRGQHTFVASAGSFHIGLCQALVAGCLGNHSVAWSEVDPGKVDCLTRAGRAWRRTGGSKVEGWGWSAVVEMVAAAVMLVAGDWSSEW